MSISGNLKDMPLTTIITVNCNEGNQARLSLKQGKQEGAIYFNEGQIEHATLGSKEGEAVVYELLAWQDGDFQVEMGVPPPKKSINVDWSFLLMEGLRLVDEGLIDEPDESGETEEKGVSKMSKLNDLLKEMSGEIAGCQGIVVSGTDGMYIASHSVTKNFDPEASSAQFALIMKLVQKTANQLTEGDEVEDVLLTTGSSYVLTRFLGDGSYYLGVISDKEMASLGNVRLIARNFANELWEAIPRR